MPTTTELQYVCEDAPVEIRAENCTLRGDLNIPRGASGLVIFAHGSGSGRKSSRNRFVAKRLHEYAMATLLLDLLTEQEERIDSVTGHLRFDISFLAGRLEAAMRWARTSSAVSELRVGLFG